LPFLAAGGAYCRSIPSGRNLAQEMILEDAAAPFVHTCAAKAIQTAGMGRRVIDINAEAETIAHFKPLEEAASITRQQLAM
jgi:hypothetical protein